MKSLKVIFAFSFILALGCKDAPDRPEPLLDETSQTATDPSNPSVTTTPAQSPEPAQNASGVWHYTCPNGCEGGGASASPCPKCGTTLVHNQAYHAGQSTPVATPDGSSPTVTPVTPPAEPAQNAKGVWHYTCPSGCAGGAGAAGPCPKCGASLTHNSAYHN